MKLDFRIEQEFGLNEPITPLELAKEFKLITKSLDKLLGTIKTWYEQGYSRKQALQHKVFTGDEISKHVINRWEKEYKKTIPIGQQEFGMEDLITIVQGSIVTHLSPVLDAGKTL